MEIEKVRQHFQHFADGETNRTSSPLYTRLSASIAEDVPLLELASHIPPSQPVPLLLFAAVHYLLLPDNTPHPHPLRAFYPDLTPTPNSGDPMPAFRDFCAAHREAIIPFLQTRLVQTNEVRRSTGLLPGFGAVYAEIGADTPLALIEVGASAGLSLLWDHYRYVYGDRATWGDASSPVTLSCDLRGNIPLLPPPSPPIAYRVGLDLNPIDPTDADQTLWLRALIWPEQTDRIALLEAALNEARKNPPILRRGDALELLPQAFAEIPDGTIPCVFHSYALNQFSREMRERFDLLLREWSRTRPIYRLSLEGGAGDPILSLLRYERGESVEKRLATCAPHGAWLNGTI